MWERESIRRKGLFACNTREKGIELFWLVWEVHELSIWYIYTKPMFHISTDNLFLLTTERTGDGKDI